MAYKGEHNPTPSGSRERPNPEGWVGGREDFETIWSLKGHRQVNVGHWDDAEGAKVSRNHGRLHETEGFC